MDTTLGILLVVFIQGLLVPGVVALGPDPPADYSRDLESTLRAQLYTGYQVLQRPEQMVAVDVTLNLLTINSLDIKSQTLSTSGYFHLWWKDSRLYWANDSTYDNINFIFSNEDYTWRPAVIVENSVSDISVFSDVNTLIRVNPEGQCIWSPGGIYETSCEADITYYPLDIQICKISLSTWSYTANEVSLQFATDPLDKTYYQENGEWEIINVSTESTQSTREDQSYSRLHFSLTFRRRPLFHILNTMFPVILMASLTIFVFKLPPESGERIGMSLTVLLAYAVYLTLISNNIPTTSLSASILSTYLSIILMLSALSVVLTIFVLDVYFNHDDQEIPAWIQTFTRNFLANVVCWRGARFCKSRKRVQPSSDDSTAEKHTNDVRLLMKGPGAKKRVFASSPGKLSVSDVDVGKMEGRFGAGMQTTASVSPEPEAEMYTWKEIAMIMDRFFLYIFVLLVVGVTVVCVSILVHHHVSAY